VEVAVTQKQQEYGLMFRPKLAPDSGMLFIYNQPTVVYYWMKNTYIPLDMLFVKEDGEIVKIVGQAQPLTLTPRGSDQPVVGVLELKGGEAARRGIEIGDRVLSPVLPIPQ
jgi:uncharacterized membrane protein (UPF0127 family)